MIDYQSINEDLADRAPGWVAVPPRRTPTDYAEALVEIERLAGCTEDRLEENLLFVLTVLVSAYEDERRLLVKRRRIEQQGDLERSR